MAKASSNDILGLGKPLRSGQGAIRQFCNPIKPERGPAARQFWNPIKPAKAPAAAWLKPAPTTFWAWGSQRQWYSWRWLWEKATFHTYGGPRRRPALAKARQGRRIYTDCSFNQQFPKVLGMFSANRTERRRCIDAVTWRTREMQKTCGCKPWKHMETYGNIYDNIWQTHDMPGFVWGDVSCVFFLCKPSLRDDLWRQTLPELTNPTHQKVRRNEDRVSQIWIQLCEKSWCHSHWKSIPCLKPHTLLSFRKLLLQRWHGTSMISLIFSTSGGFSIPKFTGCQDTVTRMVMHLGKPTG